MELHTKAQVCAQTSACPHHRSSDAPYVPGFVYPSLGLQWKGEKDFSDFKHSAFKHKIFSIFQIDFQEQFELFTLFIKYALAINVDCAF